MLPPFWDYRREYDELRDEILATVDRVFKSGQFILGREGIAFERDMAAYVGVSGGVGVNSGTDAIYIALAGVGGAAGDEGMTVPTTAVATRFSSLTGTTVSICTSNTWSRRLPRAQKQSFRSISMANASISIRSWR